jgi:hypothetical protein
VLAAAVLVLSVAVGGVRGVSLAGSGQQLFDPGQPLVELGQRHLGAGRARPGPWATIPDATCAVTTARVSSPVPMMKHAVTRPPAVTG